MLTIHTPKGFIFKSLLFLSAENPSNTAFEITEINSYEFLIFNFLKKSYKEKL